MEKHNIGDDDFDDETILSAVTGSHERARKKPRKVMKPPIPPPDEGAGTQPPSQTSTHDPAAGFDDEKPLSAVMASYERAREHTTAPKNNPGKVKPPIPPPDDDGPSNVGAGTEPPSQPSTHDPAADVQRPDNTILGALMGRGGTSHTPNPGVATNPQQSLQLQPVRPPDPRVGTAPQVPHQVQTPLGQPTSSTDIQPASAPNGDAPTSQSFQQRIRKVPTYLDGHGSERRVYEPVLLSLGPYHAAKAEFFETDMFKDEVLHNFILKGILKRAARNWNHWIKLFYGHVLSSINEIISYYDVIVVNKYEAGPYFTEMIGSLDRQNAYHPFALTILRDACYIASYMENLLEVRRMIFDHLGTGAAVIIVQDLYKLENQIPFGIIKHVLDLTFGKARGDEIVCKFLSFDCFLDHHQFHTLPWEDEPLHLLEAYRATFLKSQLADEADGSGTESHFLTKLFKGGKTLRARDSHSTNLDDLVDSPFRSVTYLQTKGIHVRSSSSYSLIDIMFTSNPCYGTLQLPTLFVDDNTKVLFSNLIAFEMSAGIQTDYSITCYVNFMKSLIERPEDVKKLQEERILCSHLGSDEEIVKMFNEISTHGINNFGIFAEVKRRIDEHCDSKAKTWMSELGHTYFHSPWSAIALVGAILTLCFTFLQVYFVLHPPKHDKSSSNS